MATPYKINIPMYEGPLDLLLDLIKQQKMNIHDIQISKITAQYLDYLQAGRAGRGCVGGIYLYGGYADLHQEQDAAAAGSFGGDGRGGGRSAGRAGAAAGGAREVQERGT